VSAMPSPSSAARQARSASRPHPAIHRNSQRLAIPHEWPRKGALLGQTKLNAAMVNEFIGIARRSPLCEEAGAPNTPFHRSVTRTAIYPQRQRSCGPIPASKPSATRSIGASPTCSSNWVSGRLTRSGPIPARPRHRSHMARRINPQTDPRTEPFSSKFPTHRRSDRLPEEPVEQRWPASVTKTLRVVGAASEPPRRPLAAASVLKRRRVTWSRDAAARKLVFGDRDAHQLRDRNDHSL